MIIAAGFKNLYVVTCWNPNGTIAWREVIENLVPTEGLNHVLSTELKGVGYTASWFVGLISNTNFGSLQATDTAAQITAAAPSGGTNQWQESLVYSQATRPALILGAVAAGSVSNAASLALYSISGTDTLNGGFIASSAVKSGTSGVLYGEGSFASTHAVSSGQTITTQVTCTATSL